MDSFIAISGFIQRRILKTYRRESAVIYPPVDTDRFTIGEKKEDFYLSASRMVPYKRIPLIAEAFSKMPDRRLVIIGDGPELGAVKAVAGPNVSILGRQTDGVLLDHMRRAKAFVFAAEEDFGIVPLEAQACGTPVIAYGRGGSLETIIGEKGPDQTGVFFDRQDSGSIIDAVQRFERLATPICSASCRRNAERFGTERFKRQFREHVDRQLADHLAMEPMDG